MIWKQPVDLVQLNQASQGNMLEYLSIEFDDYGDDYLSASMPVTAQVKQPHGLLHGGASVVLAESVASCAAYLCCPSGSMVVGVEINANHLSAVRSGSIQAIAKPIKLGNTLQIWNIEIFQQQNRVCTSRLTVMTKPPRKA